MTINALKSIANSQGQLVNDIFVRFDTTFPSIVYNMVNFKFIARRKERNEKL